MDVMVVTGTREIQAATTTIPIVTVAARIWSLLDRSRAWRGPAETSPV
jgi:hypothetical protein